MHIQRVYNLFKSILGSSKYMLYSLILDDDNLRSKVEYNERVHWPKCESPDECHTTCQSLKENMVYIVGYKLSNANRSYDWGDAKCKYIFRYTRHRLYHIWRHLDDGYIPKYIKKKHTNPNIKKLKK